MSLKTVFTTWIATILTVQCYTEVLLAQTTTPLTRQSILVQLNVQFTTGNRPTETRSSVERLIENVLWAYEGESGQALTASGEEPVSPIGNSWQITDTYLVALPMYKLGLDGTPVGVIKTPEELRGLVSEYLKVDPTITPEQRAARLAALDAELEELHNQLNLVQQDALALAMLQSSGFTDVVSHLRQSIMQLKDDAFAKEARIASLAREIALSKKQIAASRQKDPVVAQLEILVQLREEDLAEMERQHKVGVASPTDLRAARVAVAEASLQLAQRLDELSKSGEGETLARLNDEMASVNVDRNELEIRLRGLEDEINVFAQAVNDPAALDQLERLFPEHSSLGSASRPSTQGPAIPLSRKLSERIGHDETERMWLLISDVKVSVQAMHR